MGVRLGGPLRTSYDRLNYPRAGQTLAPALPDSGVGGLPSGGYAGFRLGGRNKRVGPVEPEGRLFRDPDATYLLRQEIVRDDRVALDLVRAGRGAERRPFVVTGDLLGVRQSRRICRRRRWRARCAAGVPDDAEVSAIKDLQTRLRMAVRTGVRSRSSVGASRPRTSPSGTRPKGEFMGAEAQYVLECLLDGTASVFWKPPRPADIDNG